MNEKTLEDQIVLDGATKNLDSFVQMIHQAIFESRSNFKNKIELTFFQPPISQSSINIVVQPQIVAIQSLIHPFKDNGFEILNLFGNEISKFLMEIYNTENSEIDNNEIQDTMQRKYDFEIIKGEEPNFCRMIIHLPELNTLDRIQIIEESVLNKKEI